MIEVKNIHKSFGTLEVLKGVDLTVEKGEIVSIIGKSGAGKTTLLQIIGTLDNPDTGHVLIDQQVGSYSRFNAHAISVVHLHTREAYQPSVWQFITHRHTATSATYSTDNQAVIGIAHDTDEEVSR